MSIYYIQVVLYLFNLFKAKKLLSSKFAMCKKQKYVAPVGCGLISILHRLGGGFGTWLLWAE